MERKRDMPQVTQYLTFIIVLWFLGIVTVATWFIITDPQEIPLSAVTVLGTIYGIPAIAASLWKWSGDNMIVEIEDTENEVVRTVQPDKDNKYIFEYDPKKHKVRIRRN